MFTRSLIFLILLSPLQLVRAQWYNPEKVGKKALFIYRAAIDQLRNGEWQSGKNLLHEAIKMEPKYVEAHLSLMSAYGERKMYDSALIAFNTAWQLDSIYSQDMLLPYAINLAGVGRFEEALKWVNQYIDIMPAGSRSAKAGEYRKKTFEFALEMQKKNAGSGYNFTPENLGDSINSRTGEYYPSFTIDDSLLVFTRRMQGNREDFFSSKLGQNGKYELATPIAGDLNNQPFKGGISLSPDGDWMFFAGDFGGHGYGNFDIYFCQSTPQGWSPPFNLGAAINTEFWESSPSISPDKQTLYFSSNRSGGYGGRDLYVSHRRPDGTWSLAENMGPTVNTAADELAPFIHADNQTLYFTSGGHPGYGGSDLYVMRKGPGGEWSLPENLGYPINTIDDEGSLIVASNGLKAYFASHRSDSRGGLDLYSFDLPPHARPKRTLWVKGKVYNKQTGKGIPSAIELKDIESGILKEKISTDETGNYLITLPVGANYTFTVSRQGYLFYSNDFDLSNPDADSSYRMDIPLQPIVVNSTMELRNILFDVNAFTLKPTSFTELDKLVLLLKENANLNVEIGGHTDNTGQAADNVRLSQNRSKAVVDYLVSKGIAEGRLTAKGYGSTKPIADNNTEAGRARNRRTELKVIQY